MEAGENPQGLPVSVVLQADGAGLRHELIQEGGPEGEVGEGVQFLPADARGVAVRPVPVRPAVPGEDEGRHYRQYDDEGDEGDDQHCARRLLRQRAYTALPTLGVSERLQHLSGHSRDEDGVYRYALWVADHCSHGGPRLNIDGGTQVIM